MTAFALRRRRWFSYSLRTLFVLVTVFCIWLGVQVDRAAKQRRAAEWVESVQDWRTMLSYDYQYDAKGNLIHREPPRPQWLPRSIGKEYFITAVYAQLVGARITDEGLQLIGPLGKIKVLRLVNAPNVSDAGLAPLANLTALEFLYVGVEQVITWGGSPPAPKVSQITDVGIEHLNGLWRLKRLFLNGTHLSDAGLTSLTEMRRLTELGLADTRVTDAGLQTLSQLPQLTNLDLSGTAVTDEGLKQLKNLSSLEVVNLSNTAITDAGLQHLPAASRLRSLNLSHTKITDAGLAQLKDMTQLRKLYLNCTQITDAGLKHFKGMTRLQTLDRNGSKVTRAGLQNHKSALPTLATF